PVPASLRDTTREPVDRLRTAVKYVRSMVPRVPGGVTLFGLVPLEITDPVAYGGLASELVRQQMPFPWCAGAFHSARRRGATDIAVRCESAADAFAAHRFRSRRARGRAGARGGR